MPAEVRVSERELRDDFEAVFDKLGTQGDLVWVEAGKQTFLLVNGADEVREVLVDRASELVKPRTQAIEIGPREPELVDGAIPVQPFRRALTRGLADADPVPAVRAAVAIETAAWRAGDTVALMPALRRIAIRTAVESSFASSLDDSAISEVEGVLHWFDEVPRVTSPDIRKRHRFSRHGLRAQLVMQRLAGVSEQLVANADPERPSELDAVRDAPAERRSGLVGELLLGAVGPLAQTSGWLVWRLATEPDAAAALRADGAGAEAFVREVTRLHPTNPRITRVAVGDTEVGGVPVAAHTRVILNVNRLSRDPRHYDDPERFAPERWLDGRPNAHKFAYVSFGIGDRRCVGETLAMAALAELARELAGRFNFAFGSAAVSAAGRRQLADDTQVTLAARG